MVKCTVSRHTSCICKTPPSQCSCFILTSHPCTHQTLAVLGFVGNKREDQDCIQGLELSFFTTTIDKVHVHKNGQTIYVQYFSSHNIKKKKKRKTWGLSTTVLAHPMSFDVFLSCSVLRSEHLFHWCLKRDVRCSPDINPNAQTFTFHVKVGKKWWKYIHYKVMMKFPAGSLECQNFQ